ncbi:MAG: thermonuclease family protein [Spirulinaceae cyanobacterium SM2_1_0]|nr:thermonuclease family protein [Spirulinaceae cyanobacterium SM2_1_0]
MVQGWRQRCGGGILLLAIALLAIACQPPPVAHLLTAEVQRIVSGQTLEVTIPSEQPGQMQRLRLLGLNAPDLQQVPWGPAARDALAAELPPRTQIQLEFDAEPRDGFQQRLAYVWRDGTLVNEQLVKAGRALASPSAPNIRYSQRLEAAQDYARIMGLGIWNPAQPLRQTPAEFRASS